MPSKQHQRHTRNPRNHFNVQLALISLAAQVAVCALVECNSTTLPSTEQRPLTSQALNSQQQHQQLFDSNEVQIIDLEADQKPHRPKGDRQPMKSLHKFKEFRTKLRNKCLTAELELDRCGAELIGFGASPNGRLVDNMNELNSVYCPKFKEMSGCIKNVTSDCYKPFERQIVGWVLSSTRRMNHKRCKDEAEKQRFLRLTSSCLGQSMMMMSSGRLTAGGEHTQATDCMGHYIGSLDAIAEYDEHVARLSEHDLQIQLACCANRRFKQCAMDQAKANCKQSLRADSERLKQKLRRTNSNSSQRQARKQHQRNLLNTMDDLKTTLDGMALTGPEFICTNVDEKFCQLHFDGRFAGRPARHRSILPAMIKIYANK